MKLDWEINNCRVLVAKVGEVTYHVAPDVISLWKPKKYSTVSEGKVEADGAVYGMSLSNAIAWCERDAECPAQPPAQDPETPKMSDKMSKFPSTMDAAVWASRCTAWFGAFRVPCLHDWFQAALSFAYVRGSEETLEKEKQKLAEPANPVAPLDSFDARDWAKEFMRGNNGLSGPFQSSRVSVDEETMVGWFANALMRGYDERRSREGEIKQKELSDRIDKQPEPGPFPADRLRDMARRIAELESWLGTKEYAPEDNLASKTWTKLEQLTNRLERLEART